MARAMVAGRADGRMAMAYEYGVPSRTELGDVAEEQYRLAAAFSWRLREIWDEHQRRRAAIYAAQPTVKIAQDAADAARENVHALQEELKRSRVRNRSTVPSPELVTRYEEAKRLSRQSSAAEKSARRDAEKSNPALKLALREEDAVWNEEKKKARQEAAAGGLYWGTYNAIADAHQAAISAVLKRRSQGLPANISYHAPGILSCQLQRQAGKPERTPALLATQENPWAGQLLLTPPDGKPNIIITKSGKTLKGRSMGRLRMRVSAAGYVDIPVIMHRPLPENADVCRVTLKRERVGHWRPSSPRWKITVQVAFYIPEPKADPDGRAVDFSTSWASAGSGRYLMARVSAEPDLPPPPANIAEWVRWNEDGLYEVQFPYITKTGKITGMREPLARRWSHPAGIRAERDRQLDKLREEITDALKADPALLGEDTPDISRWRSFARFHRLALSWPKGHPLAGRLEEWRKRDAHLWDYEAHERDQLVALRRDYYRKVAAWMTDGTAVVAISEVAVSRAKKRPDAGSEDPYQQRGSRANIQMTAPYELLSAVKSACRRRGIEVVTYTSGRKEEE